MQECVVVLSACANEEEAERIAAALVEERLAACVNALPGVRSTYRWEGKIETAREVLLIVKTTKARFEDLRRRILELHSYDTPEIVMLPILGGLDTYLDWVIRQV